MSICIPKTPNNNNKKRKQCEALCPKGPTQQSVSTYHVVHDARDGPARSLNGGDNPAYDAYHQSQKVDTCNIPCQGPRLFHEFRVRSGRLVIFVLRVTAEALKEKAVEDVAPRAPLRIAREDATPLGCSTYNSHKGISKGAH